MEKIQVVKKYTPPRHIEIFFHLPHLPHFFARSLFPHSIFHLYFPRISGRMHTEINASDTASASI